MLRILPVLKSLKNCSQHHPAHCYNVLEHSIKVVEGVPKQILIRITALFHDIGKPNCKVLGEDDVEHFWGHEKESARIAQNIFKELDYDEYFMEKVICLIKIHDIKISPTIEEVKEVLKLVGREMFEQLLILQEADLSAHAAEYYNKKINTLREINIIYKDMRY